MNFRASFFLSIGLLFLLCLMLPGSLRANTVYTYTGNPFAQPPGSPYSSIDICGGGAYWNWETSEEGSVPEECATAMSIYLNVTSGTPLDNLNGFNITPRLSGFGIGDGSAGFGYLQGKWSCPPSSPCFLTYVQANISTDAQGNITAWSVSATSLGVPSEFGYFNDMGSSAAGPADPYALDYSIYYVAPYPPMPGWATLQGDPGTWTSASAPYQPPATTPEPHSFILLGLGFVAVILKRIA